MRAEMSDSSHLDSEELQALLYGADPLEGVVGCEVADAPQGGVCRAILYVRRGDQVVCEERPFRPWIVTDRPSLAGATGSSRLEGEGLFWLHEFPDLESFRQARSALEREGVRHGTDAVAYPSPVRQFLLRSGVTFFKGMRFEDAVRMQVDIETASLSPHDPDARVLMAAVTGSRGFNEAVRGSEAEILQRLNALVKELDPMLSRVQVESVAAKVYYGEARRQHYLELGGTAGSRERDEDVQSGFFVLRRNGAGYWAGADRSLPNPRLR